MKYSELNLELRTNVTQRSLQQFEVEATEKVKQSVQVFLH